MMRLSRQELAEITGLIRKHAQAAWFARYFGVSLPVDRHGPIITQQVYQDLIKAKCGLLQKRPAARPKVRLKAAA
ncbi:DUF4224 domain-containing protein [Candidatus Glomeribacter gigasporarum]|uniref:DUF4224 domain-containing protein n=1 Tax=Candidatus Glomeribacter gigasporarum TaxID=132144 RepID=UPI0005B2ACB6|nr:DUF4224 domain-containing protein [Candidatus Glomeribacter gigasporarum]